MLASASATGTRSCTHRPSRARTSTPSAIASNDAVTLLIVALVARRDGLPAGYVALAPQPALLAALAVAVIYLASLAMRTLLGGQQVTAFEMTQTPLALLVGLGGAWRLLTALGHSH